MDKKLALYDIDGNAKFQTIATSSSNAQSAAIDTDRIMLVSASDHFVAFGTNPTATSAGFVLPANNPMHFVITKGHKVAAITHNGSGHLTILKI